MASAVVLENGLSPGMSHLPAKGENASFTPVPKSHPTVSAAAMQPEIVAHLREPKISFVLEKQRYALCIPGHAPISWPTAHSKPPAFYEETTTLVLNYLLERFGAAVLFDIGADAGYFSRVAAAYKGKVSAHAFEMRPEKIARMREIMSSRHIRRPHHHSSCGRQ